MAASESTEQTQGVFPEWKHFLGTSKDPETQSFIRNVVKRSGEITSYDRSKIENAVGKALAAVKGAADPDRAKELTDRVEERLRVMMAGRHSHSIPAIEEIQDIVESVLIEEKEVQVAKAYKRERQLFARRPHTPQLGNDNRELLAQEHIPRRSGRGS